MRPAKALGLSYVLCWIGRIAIRLASRYELSRADDEKRPETEASYIISTSLPIAYDGRNRLIPILYRFFLPRSVSVMQSAS